MIDFRTVPKQIEYLLDSYQSDPILKNRYVWVKKLQIDLFG